MPHCATRYFGVCEYQADSLIEFPGGLPGFPRERRFLAITDPAREPLLFLQSLERAALCFLAMPVTAIEPGYELRASADDLEALGLDPGRQPVMGVEALVLAVIALSPDGGITANLLAPLVVSLASWRGVQAVRDDALYGCRYRLAAEQGVAC
jgi:flagellar assembly factor FliW